jgi:ferritin-like metal-binding protein YciE
METHIKKRQSSGKAKIAANDGLQKLFTDQLKDILWSERALSKIISKMAKNIGSPNLIFIFRDQASLNEIQIERLRKIFESIGIKARGKKCEAMEGFISECENILETTTQGPVRDAGIIASFQKILHYMMPAYTTLAAYARTLHKEPVDEMLELTLAEDSKTDALLSDAALNTINFDAAIDENKVLASHYNNRINL